MYVTITIAAVVTATFAGGLYWVFVLRRRPDYVTSHGIKVWLHGYKMPKAHVEAETELWAALHNRGDASPVRGWSLHWKERPFTIRGVKYDGGAWPGRRMIWVGWKPEIAATAFVHELRHIVEGDYHASLTHTSYYEGMA